MPTLRDISHPEDDSEEDSPPPSAKRPPKQSPLLTSIIVRAIDETNTESGLVKSIIDRQAQRNDTARAIASSVGAKTRAEGEAWQATIDMRDLAAQQARITFWKVVTPILLVTLGAVLGALATLWLPHLLPH